jgi:hypothetical protein
MRCASWANADSCPEHGNATAQSVGVNACELDFDTTFMSDAHEPNLAAVHRLGPLVIIQNSHCFDDV